MTNPVKDNIVVKRASIASSLKSGRKQADNKLQDLLEFYEKCD